MSEREQLPPPTAASPTVQGGATAQGAPPSPGATTPEYSSAPMTAKRQDPVASLFLLVSGIAAGLSLLLPWLADRDVTGLTLVKDAFSALGDGVGELTGTGYIQPLTIVLGGGVLFLLGLLLLVPARGHRAVGLVVLVVALLVTVAVLVPLAVAGWDLAFFGIGFWFAIAVAVLGLLGAVKALLTRPKKA
jgi:hypothetical protein